jgi:hypothetical protein
LHPQSAAQSRGRVAVGQGRAASGRGSFEADGRTIMFEIDYFDRELSMHSPDPADPSVTQRVITIMLAAEY